MQPVRVSQLMVSLLFDYLSEALGTLTILLNPERPFLGVPRLEPLQATCHGEQACNVVRLAL